MESINEEDHEWLIAAQNKLTRMRRREAATTNRAVDQITDSINAIDALRETIGARLDLKTNIVKNPINPL